MLELSADNGQQGPRTEGCKLMMLCHENVESLRMVGLRVAGSEIGRVAPGARRGEDLMAQAAQKITLSSSRDIPFDKLVLSQSNVRRIKAGVSVEELAEDIARRGLLQGLSVRPVLDGGFKRCRCW